MRDELLRALPGLGRNHIIFGASFGPTSNEAGSRSICIAPLRRAPFQMTSLHKPAIDGLGDEASHQMTGRYEDSAYHEMGSR
jgi:hypothetical protein